MLVQGVSALCDTRFPGTGIAEFRCTGYAAAMTGHARCIVNLLTVERFGNRSWRITSRRCARIGIGGRHRCRFFTCQADTADRCNPFINGGDVIRISLYPGELGIAANHTRGDDQYRGNADQDADPETAHDRNGVHDLPLAEPHGPRRPRL